jgi:FSR family fosmidomycin resistance protein-like MFS transporter
VAVFDRGERHVLLLTGVAHAATHWAELVYPTVAVVLARETGVPLARVLGWSFAGYFLFGVGALPAGVLADRFGARRMVLCGLGAMGLASLAAGWCAPGAPLVVALGFLGIAGSVYHPAGMGLITRAVRARARGRALGVNGIWGSIGIATTPAVAAAVAGHFGWQAAFRLSGVVLLAVTALLARLPIHERLARHAPAGPAQGRNGIAAFAVLCAAAVLTGIVYRAGTLAQPAYFAERVSASGFGAAVSLAYLVGIAGQYAGGALADRRDLGWSYLAFQAASVPALLCMSAASGLPLLGAAGAFTFFSLGMQPIENSLFAQLTPERWRSTGYGVKFVLSFGLGASGVWLVRAGEQAGGLAYVFTLLAGVVSVLLVVILALVALTRRLPAPAPAEPEPV